MVNAKMIPFLAALLLNSTALLRTTTVSPTAVAITLKLVVKTDKNAFLTMLFAALGDKKIAMDTAFQILNTAATQEHPTVHILVNVKKTAVMNHQDSSGAHTQATAQKNAAQSSKSIAQKQMVV